MPKAGTDRFGNQFNNFDVKEYTHTQYTHKQTFAFKILVITITEIYGLICNLY